MSAVSSSPHHTNTAHEPAEEEKRKIKDPKSGHLVATGHELSAAYADMVSLDAKGWGSAPSSDDCGARLTALTLDTLKGPAGSADRIANLRERIALSRPTRPATTSGASQSLAATTTEKAHWKAHFSRPAAERVHLHVKVLPSIEVNIGHAPIKTSDITDGLARLPLEGAMAATHVAALPVHAASRVVRDIARPAIDSLKEGAQALREEHPIFDVLGDLATTAARSAKGWARKNTTELREAVRRLPTDLEAEHGIAPERTSAWIEDTTALASAAVIGGVAKAVKAAARAMPAAAEASAVATRPYPRRMKMAERVEPEALPPSKLQLPAPARQIEMTPSGYVARSTGTDLSATIKTQKPPLSYEASLRLRRTDRLPSDVATTSSALPAPAKKLTEGVGVSTVRPALPTTLSDKGASAIPYTAPSSAVVVTNPALTSLARPSLQGRVSHVSASEPLASMSERPKGHLKHHGLIDPHDIWGESLERVARPSNEYPLHLRGRYSPLTLDKVPSKKTASDTYHTRVETIPYKGMYMDLELCCVQYANGTWGLFAQDVVVRNAGALTPELATRMLVKTRDIMLDIAKHELGASSAMLQWNVLRDPIMQASFEAAANKSAYFVGNRSAVDSRTRIFSVTGIRARRYPTLAYDLQSTYKVGEPLAEGPSDSVEFLASGGEREEGQSLSLAEKRPAIVPVDTSARKAVLHARAAYDFNGAFDRPMTHKLASLAKEMDAGVVEAEVRSPDDLRMMVQKQGPGTITHLFISAHGNPGAIFLDPYATSASSLAQGLPLANFAKRANVILHSCSTAAEDPTQALSFAEELQQILRGQASVVGAWGGIAPKATEIRGGHALLHGPLGEVTARMDRKSRFTDYSALSALEPKPVRSQVGYTQFQGIPYEYNNTLEKDQVVVEFHDGMRASRWFTSFEDISSLSSFAEVKTALGMPPGINLTHVSVTKIPAGEFVKYLKGETVSQSRWVSGIYLGKTPQMFFYDVDTKWPTVTRNFDHVFMERHGHPLEVIESALSELEVSVSEKTAAGAGFEASALLNGRGIVSKDDDLAFADEKTEKGPAVVHNRATGAGVSSTGTKIDSAHPTSLSTAGPAFPLKELSEIDTALAGRELTLELPAGLPRHFPGIAAEGKFHKFSIGDKGATLSGVILYDINKEGDLLVYFIKNNAQTHRFTPRLLEQFNVEYSHHLLNASKGMEERKFFSLYLDAVADLAQKVGARRIFLAYKPAVYQVATAALSHPRMQDLGKLGRFSKIGEPRVFLEFAIR